MANDTDKVALQVQMAGQVVIKDYNNKFEAWVIGGWHKPMLSVPLTGLDYLDYTLPRMECTYMDSSGEQYVMIDITGYEVSFESEGEPVTGANLQHVIKLSDLLTAQTQPQQTGGVASIVRASWGRLSYRAKSRKLASEKGVVNPAFKTDYVASQVVLEFGKAETHDIILKGRLREHKLRLSVALRKNPIVDVPADAPFVVQLTSICGWNGAMGSLRIDLDDAKEIYPDNTDDFERIIEYEPAHPRTGNCPPKVI